MDNEVQQSNWNTLTSDFVHKYALDGKSMVFAMAIHLPIYLRLCS